MDSVVLNLNEPLNIILDDSRLEGIQLGIIFEDVDEEGDVL